MEFTNLDRPLTESEIRNVERSLSLVFPKPLFALFLQHNGGSPEPYVFEDDRQLISTVVSGTLPLLTGSDRHTAIETYQALVIEKELVPSSYFPFAVDGGGDYFFVDCESERVFFLDTARYPPVELKDLDCRLDQFWKKLQPEEDDQW